MKAAPAFVLALAACAAGSGRMAQHPRTVGPIPIEESPLGLVSQETRWGPESVDLLLTYENPFLLLSEARLEGPGTLVPAFQIANELREEGFQVGVGFGFSTGPVGVGVGTRVPPGRQVHRAALARLACPSLRGEVGGKWKLVLVFTDGSRTLIVDMPARVADPLERLADAAEACGRSACDRHRQEGRVEDAGTASPETLAAWIRATATDEGRLYFELDEKKQHAYRDAFAAAYRRRSAEWDAAPEARVRGTVEIEGRTPARPAIRIAPGTLLATSEDGEVSAGAFRLGPASRGRFGREFELIEGTLDVQGGVVTTRNARVEVGGSAVVTYDPLEDETSVLLHSGSCAARSLYTGETRSLSRGRASLRGPSFSSP